MRAILGPNQPSITTPDPTATGNQFASTQKATAKKKTEGAKKPEAEPEPKPEESVKDKLPESAKDPVEQAMPVFAKPLVDGVAIGEHRSSHGGSFGTSRCQLVAEAIVDAHERRARSLDARLDAVARRFADRGLNLEVPYLVPGSVNLYVL